MNASYSPEYLGRDRRAPIDRVDLIPWRGGPIEVTMECDEFTSLCPVTGQPDFGTLSVRYRPGKYLIESKSLKLYLLRFRNRGFFSEVLVDCIAGELFAQAAPRRLEVRGLFHSRGGISLEARAVRPTGDDAGSEAS